MDWKLGNGALGLIALLLSSGLVLHEIQNMPIETPAQLSFLPAPVLNPYPELKGLRVRINTASVEDLQQLPEIGEVRAKAIRAYIKAYGPIKRPSQLLEIEGLGAQTVEAIKPFLVYD